MLFSLALAWTAYAQSPGQPLQKSGGTTKFTAPTKPATPDIRGTEQSPIVIKVIPPPDDDTKSAAEKKEREDKSESDWWLVKLTGVLALLGLLQLFVFGLQARRLRQTIGEMKIATRATEKAANAAETSANAAERTIDTIEVTAERQLRAYVFATHDEPMFIDSNGAQCVTITIKNFGQTPANELLCSAYIGFYKFPLDTPLDPPELLSAASTGPLAASDSRKQFPTMPTSLNSSEIDAIRDSKGAIFVWGEVIYLDIFKKKRRTKYCLYSTGDDFTRRELAYYHEGNDAD